MKKIIFTYILGLSSLLLLWSCSENEEFMSLPEIPLVFSTDTVSFDTLFNTIPSPTKRLVVFNNNKKGVKIANVALESNGTSGFRMNVDGVYGSSINEIEIYGKDSIFIFIETTIDKEFDESIKYCSDKIIFSYENGVKQSVILDVYSQKAHFIHHETLNSDVTFDNSLPYVIYDSLVVANNATLTINPGTILHFHDSANLIVHGKLIVNGELDNEVIFRGDRTDKLFQDTPYDMLDNTWGGVYLASDCKECYINHADIHGGSYGIDCDSISGELIIKNSIIHNVAGNALRINHTKAHIANTELSNAFDYCAFIANSHTDFYNCTLAQFYPWDYQRKNALMVIQNDTNDNQEVTPWQFDNIFYNCFITGYADDEVYAEFDSEKTELGLHFYSCVLNTDISEEKYFTDCVQLEFEKDDQWHKAGFAQRDNYLSPFMLDSTSVAIGKGNYEYCKDYLTDKLGIERTPERVDAGCYQFVPQNITK